VRIAARAAVAIALLIGYYVLALAVMALAGLAVYLVVLHPFAATIKLALLLIVPSLAVLGAIAVTALQRPGPPDGLPVRRDREPALWAAIEDLARRVGTRPPDDLLLVPDVNAAVSERTRWFGLAPGRRSMLIGAPLLETLTVAQLSAVLGHELGHYGGRHTRLGGITYRGATALERTLGNLAEHGALVRWMFAGYAKLYFRVSQAVRRTQEIEADRFMVEIAGRDAAATALRSVRTNGAAWAFFLNRVVAPGARQGLAPADLFGGFRALLAEPSRREELDRIAAEPEETGPYDSHPSLGARLAAIARCPEPAGLVPDGRPATVLLTDPADLHRRLNGAIFEAGAPALGWDDFMARVADHDAAEAGRALLAAAERTTGSAPATLATVLDDLERGGGPALVEAITGDRGLPAPQRDLILQATLQGLVSTALRATGRVTVRCSWAGDPIAHIGPDGAPVDLDAAVPPGLAPAHVPGLRQWRTAWGVDLAHRPAAPQAPAPA
jgi:Zn-dependent protease with chaperone function